MHLLKSELKKRGISVAELAKMTEIGQMSLYNKINGKTSFTQKDMGKIARELHLGNEEIMNIFFGDEVSKRKQSEIWKGEIRGKGRLVAV